MPPSAEGREPFATLGAAVQAALLLLVLTIPWTGLYGEPVAGRAALIVLAASLPAIARPIPWRTGLLTAAALAVSVCTLLGVVAGVAFWDLLRLDGDAWSSALSILPDGVRAASAISPPVLGSQSTALVALYDAGLAALAAAVAWQSVARRRPALAAGAVGVSLAYRWTVLAPESPGLAGGLALAVVLLALVAGARSPLSRVRGEARAGRALALGGIVVVVAVTLGAGPLRADGPWWNWRSWEITGIGERPASYALSVDQRYGQLTWPETPVTVMEVDSTRPLPLRAIVLEAFDGRSFVQGDLGPSETRPPVDGRVELRERSPGVTPIRQRVYLTGTATSLVMVGGRPYAVEAPFRGDVNLIGDTIFVQPGLRRGEVYLVETAVPDVEPRALLRAPTYSSGEIRGTLTQVVDGPGGTGVTVPVWGTGEKPPPEAFGRYADVARLSRRIIGDAASPYAAVNRIESHLRQRYSYTETPPDPAANELPIDDFLFDTRQGFCQHFAAAMALMLRMNGIPARVAVGFTGGTYDPDTGRYRVIDRNAHSWVEVLIPGEGWLPFDPTPGRSAANPSSVSSPDYSPGRPEVDEAGINNRAVLPDQSPRGPDLPLPDDGPAGEIGASPAPADARGTPLWGIVLPLALVGGLLLLLAAGPIWRLLARARRRRTGDERAKVLGAVRELEAQLGRLGMAPRPSDSAEERCAAIRKDAGIDARRLYRAASDARFAPAAPADGTADAAWVELARIRRALRAHIPLGRRVRASLRLRPPRSEPRRPRGARRRPRGARRG